MRRKIFASCLLLLLLLSGCQILGGGGDREHLNQLAKKPKKEQQEAQGLQALLMTELSSPAMSCVVTKGLDEFSDDPRGPMAMQDPENMPQLFGIFFECVKEVGGWEAALNSQGSDSLLGKMSASFGLPVEMMSCMLNGLLDAITPEQAAQLGGQLIAEMSMEAGGNIAPTADGNTPTSDPSLQNGSAPTLPGPALDMNNLDIEELLEGDTLARLFEGDRIAKMLQEDSEMQQVGMVAVEAMSVCAKKLGLPLQEAIGDLWDLLISEVVNQTGMEIPMVECILTDVAEKYSFDQLLGLTEAFTPGNMTSMLTNKKQRAGSVKLLQLASGCARKQGMSLQQAAGPIWNDLIAGLAKEMRAPKRTMNCIATGAFNKLGVNGTVRMLDVFDTDDIRGVFADEAMRNSTEQVLGIVKQCAASAKLTVKQSIGDGWNILVDSLAEEFNIDKETADCSMSELIERLSPKEIVDLIQGSLSRQSAVAIMRVAGQCGLPLPS